MDITNFVKKMRIGWFLLAGAGVFACPTSVYVADIKEHAIHTWADNGFDVIGYQGYEYAGFGRWGGCVWYTIARRATTYEGCISKWGNEYHIYGVKALDAVKGN